MSAETPKREIAFMKIVITSDVYHKLAQFKENWKGEKATDVLIRVDVGNGKAHEQEYSLDEFLETLGFEDAIAEIKPCATCDGLGELETPAENKGGELVGPDTRPCPDCRPANDDRDE